MKLRNEYGDLIIWKLTALAVIAVLILLSAILAFFTVNTGNIAIVKRFGKVIGVKEEGLHVKIPFIDGVEQMVVREQTIKFGIGEENAPIEVSTRDMQTVTIELTMSDIVHDPMRLYQSFTGNHVRSLLVPRIRDAVQSNVAKYSIEQFVAQRPQLAQNIFEELKEELSPYGITLTNISITNHDFSDSYEAAVEAKKVAEQEVETEKQRQQKKIVEQEALIKLAELEAQKKIVEQETSIKIAGLEVEKKKLQAEANRIESESLSTEILTKQWIEKWDGVLPRVSSGDANMILSPNLLGE